MNNINEYRKEDFLKLYKVLSDKDILEIINRDILDEESKLERRKELCDRIRILESRKNNCSSIEKIDIERQLKKLKLIVESCVIDDSSREMRREYLNRNIEKIIPLLEEIIYDLVKLEEM